ncbi:phosphatidylglycerophosphatase A [Lacisediminimonas sp.]|uniref:phosphatidylglycerophosphatase A family protein n=1 Tax=Lacisediminimonas sp. TaxID=3060582 RepID=UPI00272129C8|nr:phosphatidylglycerophosphatase A [Lacisediminimonas sp.]MDO8299283.1 phosphatidylglycerophosphatase A [Lacisediminimonas sp.]
MTTLESGQTALVSKPGSRFMLAHPAHLIAQGFGSGLSRIMPGTAGTLLAWLSFNILSSRWPDVFSTGAWAVIIATGFVLGIWACGKTGRDLGISDHGSMVWDEIIAFWLVLLLLAPVPAATQLWAFIWFRIFDMVKPPPIGWFDRHIKGGFGVMWDDIIAAFYTLLLFALWRVI